MSNAGLISNIKSGISSKKEKIRKLKAVKTELTTLKSSLNSDLSSWSSAKSTNYSSGIQKDVVVKDVFEGNMAKTLKGEYSGTVKEISKGMSKAKDVLSGIASQNSKIDEEISRLESAITQGNSAVSRLEAEDKKDEQD